MDGGIKNNSRRRVRTEDMNILFATDKGYLKHVEDCIRSFSRFETEDGYDVYILHSNLDREEEKRLEREFAENVRLHFIYIEPKEKLAFPESSRYPEQIYYRIFAAFLLPPDVERILYLDADIVVINPLDELYHMEFEGNYILACTHIRKLLNKMNQIRLGIKEECPYINSGVMLMNLKELRERQNPQEVVAYVEKHKNALMLPDQDIITALYGNKTGILDVFYQEIIETAE